MPWRRRGGLLGLRDKLKRLERLAEGEMLVIPQLDGSVARFPASAAEAAFVNAMARFGDEENAPPEHPLLAAARNSSDPQWRNSFFSVDGSITKEIEDLSEEAPERGET